jgi:hypothetical protein
VKVGLPDFGDTLTVFDFCTTTGSMAAGAANYPFNIISNPFSLSRTIGLYNI